MLPLDLQYNLHVIHAITNLYVVVGDETCSIDISSDNFADILKQLDPAHATRSTETSSQASNKAQPAPPHGRSLVDYGNL
jgi:hypothetical protein